MQEVWRQLQVAFYGGESVHEFTKDRAPFDAAMANKRFIRSSDDFLTSELKKLGGYFEDTFEVGKLKVPVWAGSSYLIVDLDADLSSDEEEEDLVADIVEEVGASEEEIWEQLATVEEAH